MNTQEILISMTRYIELYYDVDISKDNINLRTEVQNIYSIKKDNTIKEYWNSYVESLNALDENAGTSKTKPSKTRTKPISEQSSLTYRGNNNILNENDTAKSKNKKSLNTDKLETPKEVEVYYRGATL